MGVVMHKLIIAVATTSLISISPMTQADSSSMLIQKAFVQTEQPITVESLIAANDGNRKTNRKAKRTQTQTSIDNNGNYVDAKQMYLQKNNIRENLQSKPSKKRRGKKVTADNEANANLATTRTNRKSNRKATRIPANDEKSHVANHTFIE